jgi:regulator of cell morphogenesis and NO signaling
MIHPTVEAMDRPIDDRDTLNEIVARHPAALAVLKRYGLDTCCGGALPLRVAAEHHGLELDQITAALHDEMDRRR